MGYSIADAHGDIKKAERQIVCVLMCIVVENNLE